MCSRARKIEHAEKVISKAKELRQAIEEAKDDGAVQFTSLNIAFIKEIIRNYDTMRKDLKHQNKKAV